MKFWHSDLNIRLTAILQFLTRGDLHVKSQILHTTFSINPVSDDTHVFTFFIHCLFSRKTLPEVPEMHVLLRDSVPSQTSLLRASFSLQKARKNQHPKVKIWKT